MKKDMFKKSLAGFFAAACVLVAPCGAVAIESAGTEECAKDYLLSYFPAPIVKETLKQFNIPQDKWDGIIKSLGNKDKEVVKIVEQKASQMNPNPLKDPQQRQAAVKLFRETLMQVFTDALKENNLTDTSKFQAMLDDIQQQKAKKFAMCMDKQRQKAQELDKAADDSSDNNDVDNDGDEDEEETDETDEGDEDEDEDEDEKENKDKEHEKEKASTNPMKKY